MLLSRLVQVLGADLAPYAVLLVVPLMPLVSAPDPGTREAAAAAFASLVALLPIALVRCASAGYSTLLLPTHAICSLLQSILKHNRIVAPLSHAMCRDWIHRPHWAQSSSKPGSGTKPSWSSSQTI